MHILNDGTIIQSSLTLADTNKSQESYFKDFALKRGIVTAIYYPDEESNISKRFIEYDVSVTEERADGTVSSVSYLRCQAIDLFGAPDAYVRFTFRPPAVRKDKSYQKGSNVLLLVASGNAAYGKAFIIGGFYNESPIAKKPKKADGQFYEFFYNGIEIKIDKDGQYTLAFNSMTDHEGKKANPKAAGTKLSIDREGNLIMEDNQKQIIKIDRVNNKIILGGEQCTLTIDQKEKKVFVKSSGAINVEAKEEISVKAKDLKVNLENMCEVKTQKDISLDAQSNIKVKGGSNLQVQSGSNVQVKAGANLTLESSSNAQIKGGTMTLIGQGTVPAAGVGISQCMGVGNLGAPVISNIITGSATVFIGS